MITPLSQDPQYVQGARDGLITGYVMAAVWVTVGAVIRAIWRRIR